MQLYIRYPDAPLERRFWFARFYGPDPARPGRTKPMLWCTKQIIKAQAAKIAREHIAQIRAGNLGGKTRAPAESTLADVKPLYLRHATCQPASARNNWLALCNLLRRALGPSPAPEERPLSILNPDTLRTWRSAAYDHAADIAEDDPLREGSARRSQNSILNQARSVFTPLLREHYEQAGLPVTPALLEFLSRPGIEAPVKTDYQKPDDVTLLRTFESLETQRTQDPWLYAAVWLALGFGLRRGEISACRIAHLVSVGGRIHCRLPSQKNREAGNQSATDIPVHNGAWDKLAPLLAGRDPNEFLLAPTDEEERTERVYVRLGQWMRALGWQTQKTTHEFRAYAGCSVIESHGLDYGSRWLRHSTIELTRRYYGRYVNQTARPDSPLYLPTLAPVATQ